MAVVFIVVLVLFTSGACSAVSLTCPPAVDGIPYRLTCSGGYTSWSWKVFWELYNPENADQQMVSECRAKGPECTSNLKGYSATFSFNRSTFTFSSDLLIDVIIPSHQNQIVSCRVNESVREKCTLNVIKRTENASCQAMPFLKPGVLITCVATFVPSDMHIRCHLFYISDKAHLENYSVIKGFEYMKNIESDRFNSHSCSVMHFPNMPGTYSYRSDVFYERDNLAYPASPLFEFNNVFTIPHPNVHLETFPNRNKNVIDFICTAHGYQATPHFQWYVGNSQVTTDITPEVFTDTSNCPRQLSYKMTFPLSLSTLGNETHVSCEVMSASVTIRENISLSDITLGNEALYPDTLMFTMETKPPQTYLSSTNNQSIVEEESGNDEVSVSKYLINILLPLVIILNIIICSSLVIYLIKRRVRPGPPPKDSYQNKSHRSQFTPSNSGSQNRSVFAHVHAESSPLPNTAPAPPPRSLSSAREILSPEYNFNTESLYNTWRRDWSNEEFPLTEPLTDQSPVEDHYATAVSSESSLLVSGWSSGEPDRDESNQ